MKYTIGFILGVLSTVAATALAQYPSATSIAIGTALADSGNGSVVDRLIDLEKRVTALEKK